MESVYFYGLGFLVVPRDSNNERLVKLENVKLHQDEALV